MRPALPAVVIVLLCLFAGLFLYTSRQRDHYQSQAESYLRESLAAISDWQAKPLTERLAPEARAAVTSEQLQTLLAHYRPLGQLQRIDAIEFTRLASALSILSEPPRLGYQIHAIYEGGEADIAITLLAHDSGLQIYNFNLASPALEQKPQGTPAP